MSLYVNRPHFAGQRLVKHVTAAVNTHVRKETNSVTSIRKWTIPTERPPLVSEVSANFCVVSATDPHGRILGFLDRSRYYFFQLTPQLYSRGCVDPAPGPPLLRKSGSAGNRTWDLWICSQELWPLDHIGGDGHTHVTLEELFGSSFFIRSMS
jgi:hypothetical protein